MTNDDRYEDFARKILLRHRPQAEAPEDAVEMPATLARHAARMIDRDPFLNRLAERSGDALAMRHGLSRLELPPVLAFLLAQARTERPQLFDHLLLVALIAHYLVLRRDLSAPETASVLLAGLCHDLGELYTDPALLALDHRIGDEERRFVYVHPITGYLVVQEVAGLDPNVATAVLQHQERLDGSGYPYGLRAERIGPIARIIGIADVCAAILGRFASHRRLDALLRLNRQKFDIGLLSLLQDSAQALPQPARQDRSRLPQARIRAAAELLERWAEFRPALAHGGVRRELAFLIERMAALRHMLVHFGFDPESQQLLLEIAGDDPAMAAELDAALDEVHWQFRDLEREILRRREAIEPLLDGDGKRLLNEWTNQLRGYMEMAGD
jgi:hypothetical protein